jgi:hypothetical protein
MKSLYSFLSRAESASNVKLSVSTATNQTENLFKKFILRSAGIVAFLLFLGGSVAGQCTHTIQLTDTYGDGWNGGAVSVSVNGTVVLTDITLSSGFGPANFTFTASAGQTIRVYNTTAGSWLSERRIRVDNPAGTVVIALVQPVAGTATTGGSTGSASCPAPTACTSTTVYGTGVAPEPGATTTLTSCAYAGEHSTITSVPAATAYTSTGTGGSGNWLTIRLGSASGTVIAQGNSPLNWTSTTAGTYVQIVNTNSACGTDAACHTLAVSRASAPPPTACSGIPSPGNTVASSASVATGSTVNLSLSTPPTGSGLTYQWQSGPTNTGAWTNVGTSAATYVPTVSATTWYRCIVTCSGVTTGTSAPVQVTAVVANNIPISGSSSVACGTSTLIYDHAGASTDYTINANGYIVLNNNLGSTSVISLTGTYATEANYDYLRIYNGTGTAGTLIASYSGSGTITPFTSSAGQTITVQFTSDGSANAAGISLNAVYSGSCVVPVCSGTPTPGNTISSASFVAAPSGNVNLSLQNATVGTGVTYQWQSSTSQTGTYTNIGGATSSTYTATVSSVTWFRCVVTCAGNSGTSDPVQVTLTACIPTMTYGCTDGDVIARVILNTLDNNSGTGCPSGTLGYSNYTTNAALTTTLQPSTSYSCIVYAGQYAANYAAWIDYNDNLVFEASERIGYTLSTVAGSGFVGVLGSSASFPVTLACTPPAGQHLLRIREVYNQTSGVTITPCGNNEGFGYGEIEDYMITIAPAPACPSPGLVSSITASSNSVALTWATSCSSASSYDFEYGPVGFTLGSGTLVSNQTVTISAPNASYTVTGLQAGTNYDIYYRANCGSSTSAWSLTSNFSTPNSVSAASSTPTLCQGTVMTSITHNTQGATGIGTATGLPSGVTAAWSSNIITISGIPTVSGVFGYSIPLTGGFGSLNATGTITVLEAPIAPTATSPQQFCETSNSTIASLQYSSIAGSSYLWYTASTGGTSLSTSQGLTLGTTTYYLEVVGSNGCISLSRTPVVVTEDPLLTATVSITGTTACPGGVLLFTSTPVNGGTNPTFQWYNGGIAISGANQSTYSATGLAPGDVINVKMVPSGSCVTVCQ